jgi:hypothetical protein
MRTRLPAYFAVSALLLAGCSGFVSTPVGTDRRRAADGIHYYLPMAPIVVQVALDASGVKTVSIPAVTPVPDRSKPYLLTIPTNLVSQNHATIEIGANGLLTSAGTTQTSGVDALVKAVAATLGAITTVAAGAKGVATKDSAPCGVSTTHSLLIDPKTDTSETILGPICGLTVSLKRMGGESPIIDSERAIRYDTQHSGIFYKMQIPYQITVTEKGASQSFIAYSPSASPVLFAPLAKSFFANNKTTFTLSNGMLTKAESDIGGELTGLVTLPATAISAYMTAVGGIFTAFSTNSANATEAALANAKLQICKSTVAANPLQGVSPEQAATNYAAIKAACS